VKIGEGRLALDKLKAASPLARVRPALPPKSGACRWGRAPRPPCQKYAAKRLMITAALGMVEDVASPSNGRAAASRTSMSSERSRMPSASRRFSNSTITPQLANAKSSIRTSVATQLGQRFRGSPVLVLASDMHAHLRFSDPVDYGSDRAETRGPSASIGGPPEIRTP